MDRLPVVEWAVWRGLTLDRWHTEGLPTDVVDRFAVDRHFGLDTMYQGYVTPMDAPALDKLLDARPDRDWLQNLAAVSCQDDYERILPALYEMTQLREAVEQWEAWSQEQQSGSAAVWLTVWGFFGWPRFLFGQEPHLYAFYDLPDLMHRMNEDCLQHVLKCLDPSSNGSCPWRGR